MKKIKYFVLALCMAAISLLASAQDGSDVEMADTMRSNGKIYVVIAVLLTILAGLILYVVRLDKKISKLEKEK